MQVIAQRDDTTFMLLVEGRRNALRTAKVRVFDTSTSFIGPVMPAVSVFARGYWDEVSDSIATAAIITEAETILGQLTAA